MKTTSSKFQTPTSFSARCRKFSVVAGLLLLAHLLPFPVFSGHPILIGDAPNIEKENDGAAIAARGTGRTTGHIITLFVKNKGDKPVRVPSGSFYIPSDGRFQSYVGRIEKPVDVAVGAAVEVPVNGFCTDVHTPPVPDGQESSPFEDWILVRDRYADPQMDDILTGGQGYPAILVPGIVLEEFKPAYPVRNNGKPAMPPHETLSYPEMHPDYVYSPRPPIKIYYPGTDIQMPEMVPTIPGTTEPIGGTISPESDPVYLAPVLVKALELIEGAATAIQEGGHHPTPFSPAPEREREALVQQTLWITAAAVTGAVYVKDDFEGRVYEQYKDNTGIAVAAMPPEQKEKIDEGIDNFWSAFSAVGIEAKVLSADSQGLDIQDDGGADDGGETAGDGKCTCGDISADIAITRGSKGGLPVYSGNHTFDEDLEVEIEEISKKDKFHVSLSNIKVKCPCSNGGDDCKFYPPKPGEGSVDTENEGKVDIDLGSPPSSMKKSGATEDDAVTSFDFDLEIVQVKAMYIPVEVKAECYAESCGKGDVSCRKEIKIRLKKAEPKEKE